MFSKLSLALIAIGGNLPSLAGHPEQTLRSAICEMARNCGRIRAVSRFYSTPCFPAGAGPDFVNGAVVIETGLAADQLLTQLHRIEAQFGRVRETRWAGRTLDLDLLGYQDLVHPNLATFHQWESLPLEDQMRRAPGGLILPHPRLHERGFVLVPVADVAPKWRHPVFGKTIQELLNALPKGEINEIRPI